jgi:hypothetical protein
MKYSIEKNLISILIVLTFLASTAAIPVGKFAQEQSNVYTFQELGILSGDDSFKGINTVKEYGFQWPSIWEPLGSSTLTLKFSHAKALSERSSIAVEVNGTRLTSVELTSANSDTGEVTVEIPKELLVAGYNRVRLSLYLGYEGFDCMDLDDDLLWFTVHAGSFFSFQYQVKDATPLLHEFPQSFVSNSGIIKNSVTFILPIDPTSAEVNAAALISAKLGQYANWRTVDIHFASEADVQLNANAIQGNIILVGRADHLALLNNLNAPWTLEDGKLKEKDGTAFPENSGVLWSGQFYADAKRAILVVTGDSDAAVVEAAKALTRDSILAQLPDTLAVVGQVPESVSEQETFTATFTLEKYSYRDVTAWGTSEQSITYALPFASSWKVMDDVSMRLHFAHTDFSNLDESYVTVEVNGTPAGTIALSSENANDAWVDLVLPARLFDFGDNTITILSNINLPDAYLDSRYDCLEDNTTAAWLVIYADTEFTVPLGPSTDVLSINEFPYAFIGSSDLSDFGVVLPDQPNVSINELVIRLSEFLGHYLNSEGIGLRIYNSAELASLSEKPSHLMLIGTPTQNPEIAKINDRLPQSFEAGTNNPVAQEGIVQTDTKNADIGYLEALLDVNGNPILVATGTTDQGIIWAVNALMDTTNIKNLYGDLALTRAEGSISSAMIQDTEKLIPVSDEKPIQPQVEKNELALWIGIVFAVITFAVVVGKAIDETVKKNKARKHG